MNCIEKCKHGAISYKYHPFGKPAAGKANSEQINETRRSFFTATALVAATSVLKAQEKKVDGGLAAIEDKKIPERSTPLTPPGSLSARNMAQHCTACQLCVSACPNQVLRPSADLRKFDAAGNVIRTRLLQTGMYKMFGGMSCRGYPSDNQS